MELPNNDILIQGHIKFKGKSLGIWKKQWAVLKRASSRGGRRLECYADDKTASNNNKCEKVIDLGDVIQVQGLPSDIKKYGFSIVFSDKTARSFCCDSDRETSRWMRAIEELCLSQTAQVVNSVDLLQSGPSQKEYTELFNVYLLQSPNLSIYGECLLQVTEENIYVLDNSNTAKRLVTWPLNALRRYGSDANKFTFESGRFCETGEGIFIFNTTDGEAIYQKVHSATIAIAEMHRMLLKSDRANRGISLPSNSPTPRLRAVTRSKSSPSCPGGEAPEPPPRPVAANAFSDSTNSAVNSPLPPIPRLEVTSEYLSSPYEGGPPLEQAPTPPKLPGIATHMGGRIGPQMYHNVGQGTGYEEEYYGQSTPTTREGATAGSEEEPVYGGSPVGVGDSFRGVTNRLSTSPTGQSKPHPNYVNQMAKPPSDGGANGEDAKDYEPVEYIYAEKELSREFRRYLKERKGNG